MTDVWVKWNAIHDLKLRVKSLAKLYPRIGIQLWTGIQLFVKYVILTGGLTNVVLIHSFILHGLHLTQKHTQCGINKHFIYIRYTFYSSKDNYKNSDSIIGTNCSSNLIGLKKKKFALEVFSCLGKEKKHFRILYSENSTLTESVVL